MSYYAGPAYQKIIRIKGKIREAVEGQPEFEQDKEDVENAIVAYLAEVIVKENEG